MDPGATIGGTTEAKEMILTRDMMLTELRSRGFEVLSVPDDLSLTQTIDWINSRARSGDVALEIHADAFSSPTVRGASIFYIANNDSRRKDAEGVLLALLRRVPQLPNRGAKPDTTTGVGSLGFCRQVVPPSLLLEVGFLSNLDDRFLLQNRRRDIALGIVEGLTAWSRAVSPADPVPQPAPTTYPSCNININGQVYGEQGILVNGNGFIPVDLIDRLNVDISQDANIRRINYNRVVYAKAVDLRDYHISVGWDNDSRTVLLRSVLQICPDQIDRIAGRGYTSEVQLMLFLKANNEAALTAFPDLAKLYKEEGQKEGISLRHCFLPNVLGNQLPPLWRRYSA